jgi:hypothetical protein
MAMNLAVVCEEKLASRADHASWEVLEKRMRPCTTSLDVDMMAERIAASCWCHAVYSGL